MSTNTHKKYDGVKTGQWDLNQPIFLYLDLQRQYRYKQTEKKPAHIHFHSEKPHTITKMNDNLNTDSATVGSMNPRS